MVLRVIKTTVSGMLVCCCSVCDAQSPWPWAPAASQSQTQSAELATPTKAPVQPFQWSAVPSSESGLIGSSATFVPPITPEFFNNLEQTNAARNLAAPGPIPAYSWPSSQPSVQSTTIPQRQGQFAWDNIQNQGIAPGRVANSAASPQFPIPWEQSARGGTAASIPQRAFQQQTPQQTQIAKHPATAAASNVQQRVLPPPQPLADTSAQPTPFTPATLASSRVRHNVVQQQETVSSTSAQDQQFSSRRSATDPVSSPAPLPAELPVEAVPPTQLQLPTPTTTPAATLSIPAAETNENLAPQFALLPMTVKPAAAGQPQDSQNFLSAAPEQSHQTSAPQSLMLQEFEIAEKREPAAQTQEPLEIMPFNRLITSGTAIQPQGSLQTSTMTGPMEDAGQIFSRLNLGDDFRDEPSQIPTAVRGDMDMYGNEVPWGYQAYTWTTPTFAHRPLYFEQPNLERYGNGARRVYQPALSAAHFFGSVAALPYKMFVSPPNEPVYTLGHRRPGDCVPHQGRAFLGQKTIF